MHPRTFAVAFWTKRPADTMYAKSANNVKLRPRGAMALFSGLVDFVYSGDAVFQACFLTTPSAHKPRHRFNFKAATIVSPSTPYLNGTKTPVLCRVLGSYFRILYTDGSFFLSGRRLSAVQEFGGSSFSTVPSRQLLCGYKA